MNKVKRYHCQNLNEVGQPKTHHVLASDYDALLNEHDRLKKIVIEWNIARNEAEQCPDILLSSGNSDEATKRMRSLKDAELALKEITP